jgi:ribose transport system substrate-binding protein
MEEGGRDRSGRWAQLASMLLAVAVLFGLAACGGDDGTTDDGGNGAAANVEEAEQIVADAEEPITEGPSAPEFDASAANGKKVWFISLAMSVPYSQQVYKGVQQGAEALGMEAKSFDGKFSPAEITRGIDLAIQDGADAIIVHALPPSVVAPALAKAKENDIALISAETQNPGPPLPDVPDTIDAIAGHSYSIPAETMAATIVADSEGEANVIFFSASDIGPGSKQGTDTFVAKMEELCPDCPVEVIDSPVAQWSGLTQRITSILRANPDVNYVVPIFDGMALTMLPGIRSSGADVKLVSGDATPSVLEAMRSGDVVIGDVGQPNVWTGFAIIDQTARVLAGEEPLEDVGIQYRLFTDNNIADLDLETDDPTPWYGEVDFMADYKRIWGVEE